MGIIFEVFLAVLLCTAIGFGIILNRRIRDLRNDQENLDKLAKSFVKATSRAEASIQHLKAASDATSQALDQTIQSASQIREDLLYLLERGEKLADLLESGIRSKEKRPVSEGNFVKKKGSASSTQSTQRPTKGEAELKLIKALRAVR